MSDIACFDQRMAPVLRSIAIRASAVLISGAAALLIGAAPHLINFFFDKGSSLH